MELRTEPHMPEETVEALERMGHKIARRREGISDGKVQLIVRDKTSGVLMGASDPRGDGHAAAW
jgi:gamma-glutamyltranspeptidase/glutathione hydrolase